MVSIFYFVFLHKDIISVYCLLGWKRLVINRSVITSKKCDVFYSPPMSNSRLRSKKAIQKLLISLNNHTLTTKNFTFIDDHIGVNDPDKEIIRYARTKVM